MFNLSMQERLDFLGTLGLKHWPQLCNPAHPIRRESTPRPSPTLTTLEKILHDFIQQRSTIRFRPGSTG